MNRESSSPRRSFVHRTAVCLLIAGTALGGVSCSPEMAAGIGNIASLASQYGGGYMPSHASTALSAIVKLSAIAQYQAEQQQLAAARAKVQTSSKQRQYVRVKPSGSSTAKGTHVIPYNPNTGKLENKVIVVPETNLSSGQSVSINGQAGKII